MQVKCPICEALNEDRDRCRQCSTDLGPVIRVSDLPGWFQREAVRLFDAGRPDAACEALAASAALDPDSADAHVGLALGYLEQGLSASAAAHVERAAALAPDRADVAAARGRVAQSLGDREKALAAGLARARRTRRLLWGLPAAAFAVGALTIRLWPVSPPTAPAPEPPRLSLAAVRQAIEANRGTRGLDLRVVQQGDRVVISGDVPSALHVPLVEAVAGAAAAGQVDVSGLVVPAPAPTPGVAYTVRAGDSLWSIAGRKYGHPDLWPQIVAANEGRVDPARLPVGRQLTLPPVTVSPR